MNVMRKSMGGTMRNPNAQNCHINYSFLNLNIRSRVTWFMNVNKCVFMIQKLQQKPNQMIDQLARFQAAGLYTSQDNLRKL